MEHFWVQVVSVSDYKSLSAEKKWAKEWREEFQYLNLKTTTSYLHFKIYLFWPIIPSSSFIYLHFVFILTKIQSLIVPLSIALALSCTSDYAFIISTIIVLVPKLMEHTKCYHHKDTSYE